METQRLEDRLDVGLGPASEAYVKVGQSCVDKVVQNL